jgi:hypothetical protein
MSSTSSARNGGHDRARWPASSAVRTGGSWVPVAVRVSASRAAAWGDAGVAVEEQRSQIDLAGAGGREGLDALGRDQRRRALKAASRPCAGLGHDSVVGEQVLSAAVRSLGCCGTRREGRVRGRVAGAAGAHRRSVSQPRRRV